MSLSEPVLTGPGAGRSITYGDGSVAELKIVGEQAGGDWAVIEQRVHPGDEPPMHTHTREDETLYVLEGAITAYVGDQRFEVEAGSYAALPNKVRHGFSVRGDEARILITVAPAGVEYFFVPRDEADQDPNKYGLIIEERVPAAA
jgi:quercetin dioxygenase-like cupin family protein